MGWIGHCVCVSVRVHIRVGGLQRVLRMCVRVFIYKLVGWVGCVCVCVCVGVHVGDMGWVGCMCVLVFS